MRINWKKYRAIGLVSILLASSYSFAQTSPTWNGISRPLDTAIVLAGTFGEIRQNHFHSGIDISTGGEEGKKVMAASDGYVSRIKVSSEGFGKALYITHPNGYVTVYGHLQRFNDSLEKYVRAEQYRKESFEVELFPREKNFFFKRGDLIAFSGNTGGSTAPHLHFEIRDHRTEEPMEPLQSAGFSMSDAIPPEIKSIVIYPMNKNGSVNGICQKLSVPLSLHDKIFSEASPKKNVVNGEIGFGIETFDKQIQQGAELGIKSIELFIDGERVYDYSINRFRFDESRFVNANIDFAEAVQSGKVIISCCRLPGSDFSMTLKNEASGIINFSSDESHMGLFRVCDFNNNISQASFNFISTSKKIICPVPVANDTIFFIAYDKPFRHETVDMKVSSDKLPAVYENTYLAISKKNQEKNYFSKIFRIGEETIPVHNAVNLSIKPNNLPQLLRPKALIVRIEKNGTESSSGGSFVDEFITTKIRGFGNYAVTIDTIPPTIQATNLSSRSAPGKIKFRIKIKDDLSGIGSYRATLDKHWMLMEYDAKTGTLTGETKVKSKNKSHRFVLTVTDKKGNKAQYSSVLKY